MLAMKRSTCIAHKYSIRIHMSDECLLISLSAEKKEIVICIHLYIFFFAYLLNTFACKNAIE